MQTGSSDLSGRTAVVTGATSGLGAAVAMDLAGAGARVVVVGRDAARARETADRCAGRAEVVLGDVSTRAGARAVAEGVRQVAPKVDLLVNNAGGSFPSLGSTADGVETTFALNTLGAFVLERALHDRLIGGRVINVATGFLDWFPLDPDELVAPKKFSSTSTYGRAKLASVMMTVEQARRYPDVRYVSMHPGVILGTRFGGGQPAFVQSVFGPVMRAIGFASSLEEAVRRFRVSGWDDVPTGSYLSGGRPVRLPRQAEDAAIRERVWALLERLAGEA